MRDYGWDRSLESDAPEAWKLVDEATLETIRSSLREYYPGLWAQKADRGPACCCNAKRNPEAEHVYSKHGKPTGECRVHTD